MNNLFCHHLMLIALPQPRWQQLKQGLCHSIPGRTSLQDCRLQTQLRSWCLLWLRPLLPVPGKGHRQGSSLGPFTSLAPETHSPMSLSKCRPRSALWSCMPMQFCIAVLSHGLHPNAFLYGIPELILLPSKGLPARPRCFTVQSSSNMPSNQVKLSPYSWSWLSCTHPAASSSLVHAPATYV